uniref:Uncharacterized protein n=1 Tax=Gasterosteus aculeatus TaxID=69293 RepID=G3PTQ1_GASAC
MAMPRRGGRKSLCQPQHTHTHTRARDVEEGERRKPLAALRGDKRGRHRDPSDPLRRQEEAVRARGRRRRRCARACLRLPGKPKKRKNVRLPGIFFFFFFCCCSSVAKWHHEVESTRHRHFFSSSSSPFPVAGPLRF